jgi:site-specific recombinase XerD
MTSTTAKTTALPTRSDSDWVVLTARVPVLAATMRRYLGQQAVTLSPNTIDAADRALRIFGLWIHNHDPSVVGAADITRAHIEAFKLKLTTDVHPRTGQPLAVNTIRGRLQQVKVFFDRIVAWDLEDAPRRNPIIHGDVPPQPAPLPKFLDDAVMAKFMHHVHLEPVPIRKLCVLLLARTGMRVGELCALPADPVVRIGDHHWLHVPVGKLRNDRYVPLHPELVQLITQQQADNANLIAATERLLTDKRSTVDRHRVTRMVRRIAKRAGIGHVHPHQLRHTLATQAINRGMRLEAVAALLGHKNLDMTLVYARIADRTIADEYNAVSSKVDHLYSTRLPADAEGPNMQRLRQQHQRMLGNGWCQRPAAMDCHYETICETCTYYGTDPSHIPVLTRQRDHAQDHHQPGRARLYQQLLDNTQTGG